VAALASQPAAKTASIARLALANVAEAAKRNYIAC
jgi:hypothetical protein